MKGPDFPHQLFLQFFSLSLCLLFLILYILCTVKAVVYFNMCSGPLFLVIEVCLCFSSFLSHTHILSPLLEKQSAWFLFEGDYETEQIHSLSYQGSFCVISGPGVNLMAVVMFDTAKLRYLCISPAQWSLIGSLPFLLCYWEGRVEVLFIPWGFSFEF